MFRFPGRGPSCGNSASSSGKRAQKKNKSQLPTEDAGERTPTTSKSKKNDDYADLPDKMKNLRACMICSLVKTETEFEVDGCDNCESFLQLASTKGAVTSYTSGSFDGVIAMINPGDSWVAKWQRIGTMMPGMYAVNVRGEVEKWVQVEMAGAGIPYFCRDKTIQTKVVRS